LVERHFDLPDLICECVVSFYLTHFSAPGRIEYLSWPAIKKKPPATMSQGAFITGQKGFVGIPQCGIRSLTFPELA
jgi:hypothetical protein